MADGCRLKSCAAGTNTGPLAKEVMMKAISQPQSSMVKTSLLEQSSAIVRNLEQEKNDDDVEVHDGVAHQVQTSAPMR
jgi:hypothetical protein